MSSTDSGTGVWLPASGSDGILRAQFSLVECLDCGLSKQDEESRVWGLTGESGPSEPCPR